MIFPSLFSHPVQRLTFLLESIFSKLAKQYSGVPVIGIESASSDGNPLL
jgi:hypothetical protein